MTKKRFRRFEYHAEGWIAWNEDDMTDEEQEDWEKYLEQISDDGMVLDNIYDDDMQYMKIVLDRIVDGYIEEKGITISNDSGERTPETVEVITNVQEVNRVLTDV